MQGPRVQTNDLQRVAVYPESIVDDPDSPTDELPQVPAMFDKASDNDDVAISNNVVSTRELARSALTHQDDGCCPQIHFT